MKELSRCAVMFCVLTVGSSMSLAHERFTDPMLAELNDYLIALQVLRWDHPEAEALFQLWSRVREASWKIRTLTDEKDRSITDSAVQQQVEETRRLRQQLFGQCRQFFARLEDSLPTAHLRIEEKVAASWPDPVLEVPVGSREVVLLKIANGRAQPVWLSVQSERNDQILFWQNTFSLQEQHSRYAFIYLAPAREGLSSANLTLREGSQGSATIRVRLRGVPLPPQSAQFLLPGADPYSVNLPEKSASWEETSKAAFPRGQTIRFKVRDADTGHPLPVRVEVRDSQGNAHWTPLRGPSYAVSKTERGWETPLWQLQPGPYFYLDGYAELGVDPAGKTVRIHHGFEYRPLEVPVPDDGVVDVSLDRWIDMPARGWYSGQTHIHTTDVGIPVLFSEFWPLVAQAEDLNVSYILTLKGEWETHAIYANEYPMGIVPLAGDETHLVAYGEEYRSNPYGHLALLGLEELIQPISSGALGELGGPDYPPNALVLEAALAQGATTIGAHFGNYILEDEPIKAPWPSTGFEMPVDVALGKIQVAEVYGNGGQKDVWYRLLNCGFDLPATAGPDWVIKDSPRTYVYLGGKPLTLENWTEALRLGRSFITRGPMIFLEVDGARPGARLGYTDRPASVRVEAFALTPQGSLPVEVVVNGKVVAEGEKVSQAITLEDSAWIAARTNGAHTNPIYVTLQGRPRGNPEEARIFLEVTERLIDWVRRKALFDEPGQKETVLRVLRSGQEIFRSVLHRPDDPAAASPR